MEEQDSLRNGRTDGTVALDVRNVGGISAADVTLSRGVTLVAGQNASNKSSLLRSLAGVLGGPVPPLKSDADAGAVRMAVAEDGTETEYALELAREAGETVVTDADRYSSARDRCELFVALTETNPIRQAVLSGDDLYDLLMGPVDTDEIEAEIRRLRHEKDSLDDRLDELDGMADRLPGLEARRASLETELADVEASLREKRDEIADLEAEADPDDGPETAALNEKRAERDEFRDRIETQESAIESLEAEREEVADELASLTGTDTDTTVEEVDAELEQLHYQKQQLTSTINALSPIVEMNTQILDEEAEIPSAMKSDDVVAELDPSSRSITCWTCGSTVERAQIAEQVDAVREIVREKRNQRDTVTERIQSLTEQKRDLERRRDELDRLRERRDDIDDEIERRREELDRLAAAHRTVESELEDLQRQVESTADEDDEIARLYDEVSDLEYERGRLSNDLEDVRAEIDDIESALSNREDVEAQRTSVAESLREQRERIDTLERDLVGTFNEEMQHVLDTLSYEAIERIWLERRSTGDGVSAGTEFELHVVRATDDGAAYDDTVDSLSKSEREVVGLVVALAGYLAHDVGREVPFLVVDAVEMFDADRISGLMEHFSDHAEYVVATVLPSEREELAGVYDTVSTASFAADS